MGCKGKQDKPDLRVLIGLRFELSVSQQRMKYTKIGVAALS